MLRRFKYIFCLLFLFLFSNNIYSQDSVKLIKVFFLYGSKPYSSNDTTEKHLFGGIHGGHVSIGIDSTIIGFHHLKGVRIFPHHKNLNGAYESYPLKQFIRDTVSKQYAEIDIPVSNTQYCNLRSTFLRYCNKTPYDYAFFGMRCTAAAYDLLSKTELVSPKSKTDNIISNFYPKKLRRHLFKIAKENNYIVYFKRGTSKRIWEKD